MNPASRVEGRIDKDGIFHGEIYFATGYHISAPKGENIKTPTSWWNVKAAMERQSGSWTVLRERKMGDAKFKGYTVKV